VSLLRRRLRSLVIAIAVLALSAGAVLAGRSGLATPVRTDQVAGHADGSDTETEGTEPADAPETEPTEAPETDQADAPGSASTDTSTGVHPDNHGKLVSEAAQAVTPGGFANHGAYVKTVARNNAGHAAAGTGSTTAAASTGTTTAATARAKHTKSNH
jgi:hypothetical protein